MSETPVPNARFIDIGGGVTAEYMAHTSQFTFNPNTDGVRVIFNSHPYIVAGAQYHRVGDVNDILHVDLKNMMTMRPAEGVRDPVTGMDLSGVSVAGVLLIVKGAFNFFFNKRALELAQAAAGQQQEHVNSGFIPEPHDESPPEIPPIQPADDVDDTESETE